MNRATTLQLHNHITIPDDNGCKERSASKCSHCVREGAKT